MSSTGGLETSLPPEGQNSEGREERASAVWVGNDSLLIHPPDKREREGENREELKSMMPANKCLLFYSVCVVVKVSLFDTYSQCFFGSTNRHLDTS